MENPERKDLPARTLLEARTHEDSKAHLDLLDKQVQKVPTALPLQEVRPALAHQVHRVHRVHQAKMDNKVNQAHRAVQANLEKMPNTARARREPPLQPLWLERDLVLLAWYTMFTF